MQKKILMMSGLVVIGFAAGWLAFVPGLDLIIEKTRNIKKNNLTYNGSWTASMDAGSARASAMVRAYAARMGLGANASDEAIYWISIADNKGQRLEGGHVYEVRFDREVEIDKVRGFWSICVYNAKDLFVANDLKRYNLGDRSPLVKQPDGSFTIHVAPEPPKDIANWLPIPKTPEPISLVIRMYAPLPNALKQPEKTPLPTVVRMDP